MQLQLSDIRAAVLNYGFDPIYFSPARLNFYINKGYKLVCRRVNYYVDETAYQFQTASGVAKYAFPADLARLRAVEDTDRNVGLGSATLLEIDRSAATNGAPNYYALDGANVHLYPTPDGTYNLQLRYWNLPPDLAGDSDVPVIPGDWHDLLVLYAVALAYETEDDNDRANAFMQRFLNGLAMFKADQQFVNSDEPFQIRGMWDSQPTLSPGGSWSRYGFGGF